MERARWNTTDSMPSPVPGRSAARAAAASPCWEQPVPLLSSPGDLPPRKTSIPVRRPGTCAMAGAFPPTIAVWIRTAARARLAGSAPALARRRNAAAVTIVLPFTPASAAPASRSSVVRAAALSRRRSCHSDGLAGGSSSRVTIGRDAGRELSFPALHQGCADVERYCQSQLSRHPRLPSSSAQGETRCSASSGHEHRLGRRCAGRPGRRERRPESAPAPDPARRPASLRSPREPFLNYASIHQKSLLQSLSAYVREETGARAARSGRWMHGLLRTPRDRFRRARRMVP
jgi:hypothetical protein